MKMVIPYATNKSNVWQPDVIIEYPGDRKVIVDSKVSLNAYVRYVESETEEERLKLKRPSYLLDNTLMS